MLDLTLIHFLPEREARVVSYRLLNHIENEIMFLTDLTSCHYARRTKYFKKMAKTDNLQAYHRRTLFKILRHFISEKSAIKDGLYKITNNDVE